MSILTLISEYKNVPNDTEQASLLYIYYIMATDNDSTVNVKLATHTLTQTHQPSVCGNLWMELNCKLLLVYI